MIDRNFDWFIPINPPIIALIIDIINNNLLFIILKINNIIGGIFCIVDKIKHIIHDIDDITDGYQKWNGANPILIEILNIKIICINFVNGE